jgi:hypothetical protein
MFVVLLLNGGELCELCGAREAEQLQKDRVNLKLSIELAGFVLFFFSFLHCIDGIQNGMKG